jgi:hypothetical protein
MERTEKTERTEKPETMGGIDEHGLKGAQSDR